MSEQITQLGISGITLAILFFIVRWFIQTINRKDAQISTMVDSFNTTINNHMAHETKAFNNLAKVISELGKQIKKKK
ncbi:MAG: hypothetical protein LAN71_17695 [Acidobacteriia bacterium]|nr:hypothetical protein [Terriglobia bacterium]